MRFDLGSREIGGEMRRDALRYKNIVAAQQDLGHDVALIAVVAEVILEAEVVEAVDARVGLVEPAAGIFVQDRKTVLYEFETDVAAGLYAELVAFGRYIPHERHDRGLAAADRTGKQDAFAGVDAEAEGGFVVAQEIRQQPQDDGMVIGQDAEMPPEELDAFALDPADDLIVVIVAPNSFFRLRCRNVGRLGLFHGFRILGRSASSCGPRRASRPSGSCRR